MKIIFLGDIVGKIGRQAVQDGLPSLLTKYKPNFVITNGENMAHGLGITQKTMKGVLESGVDFITSGNHIFTKKEEAYKIFRNDELKDKIVRPANYTSKKPGDGAKIITDGKYKLLVIALCGRVFVRGSFTSPFKKFDRIYKDFEDEEFDAILVDFHAETTSEKLALAHYIKNRASALVGTHTHVATADEQIFNNMAYITDVGMTGPKDSILGENKESIIEHYLKNTRHIYKIEEDGAGIISGVYIEIDPKTKEAKKIERIYKEIK
ncbi:MAG: YmdB family metallophosphoesterase [Parcubacteria group bacterium]|nr:YmdB family metallophosphoesterase [Parcubacteria group bacterium]